jgi:hypothetical protein
MALHQVQQQAEQAAITLVSVAQAEQAAITLVSVAQAEQAAII